MKDKIRILVITYLPWREDNSIGNSYSNIFRGTEDRYEFAHIYIRDGMPQNSIVHEYYHISEKILFKKILFSREPVGRHFRIDKCNEEKRDEFSKLYNKARILRWELFFLLRDIAGMPYSWKTKSFESFIDAFHPDLVFGTLSAYPIISNMMCYISKSRNIPLVTYPWDDHYTLNRKSWSPIFWLRRFQGRYYQRKSVKQSSYMYVISDLMKAEYERIFKKECRILYKGYEFNKKYIVEYKEHCPLNIVYMGNIGSGRWKSLAFLAKVIETINDKYGSSVAFLNVYTLSPKDAAIQKSLNVEGASRLNDSVPNEEVNGVLGNADVLLHVEPMEEKESQFYRASFSTKLVDYFLMAKPIFSLGRMTSSTDYLLKNDATIYLSVDNAIFEMEKIIGDPSVLKTYAQKAYNCGVKNHQIGKIQLGVYNDFIKICNHKRQETI